MTRAIRIVWFESTQDYHLQVQRGQEWYTLKNTFGRLEAAESFVQGKYEDHDYEGVWRKGISGQVFYIESSEVSAMRARDRQTQMSAKSPEEPKEAVSRLIISAFDKDGLHQCSVFPVPVGAEPLEALDKIKKKIIDVVTDTNAEEDADPLKFGPGTVITIIVA